jgi:hypothetical protein
MRQQTELKSGNEITALRGGLRAPIFVVGCPRSGTTLLYHMLLSSGNFAVYRSESNVFNLLGPKFGGMRTVADRTRLMDSWLNSLLFRASGLDGPAIRAKVIDQCRNEGDFLRIVMHEIVESQGAGRWADCTPEHLLYMRKIKRQIPDARFIHIIRDGRDVALSYLRQGWSYPLPWDKTEQLAVAALYWNWIVGKGRRDGGHLGADYEEVRFEDLVMHPAETLLRIGAFIGHDLDYATIQRNGVGSVRKPNSSFEVGNETFAPVGRWRTMMSTAQVADFEAIAGDRLRDLGYRLASNSQRPSIRTSRLRATYLTLFPLKQWLKEHTPLGRTVKLGRIKLEPPSND